MRDYRLFIKDIISAIESIEKFVEGMNFDEFTNDDKTSSAVIRKLEIIGEAAKNIPNFLKDKYKDIPWKNIAGMRDRLIHGYFGVDHKLVWEAIKIEIPKLKDVVKKISDEIKDS